MARAVCSPTRSSARFRGDQRRRVSFLREHVGGGPHARDPALARAAARIAFVCWRAMDDNPLFTAPLAAASATGIPMPEPADPHAPGPFAFADRERAWSRCAR